MKIQALSRYHAEDFPDAPEWFTRKLDQENYVIDTLNPLFAHGIDIDNNLQAERQIVTLSHNTPVAIKLRTLKGIPTLVRVGYAAGYVGSGAITSYNSDGTFYVTVYFHGTAPTAAVSAVLVFEV